MRLSGLCGWVGKSDTRESSDSIAAKMMEGLSIGPGEPRRSAGEGYSLALCGEPSLAHWYEDGDLVVAATGYPAFEGSAARGGATCQDFAGSFARLFQEHGQNALSRVRGPFSLVVVEKSNGRSLMAIDRFGVESLTYAQPNGDLTVFGSATDSVKAHPLVEATVAPQTIFNYLYFIDRVCAPATIYEEQQKLLPGECVVRDSTGTRKLQYWQMSYGSDGSKDEERYCDELLEQVRGAFGRSISGEDLSRSGAFLSGGLDSSTVLTLLAERSSEPAKAFTIGFGEAAYDETGYAKIAAEHVEALHDVRILGSNHVSDAIEKVTEAFDEPFANSSVIPTYYCALAAKETGIDLMLAGDGGDELFVGNSRYISDRVFQRYRTIPAPLRRSLVEPIVRRLPFKDTVPLFRKASNYVNSAKLSIPARLTNHNAYSSLDYRTLFAPDALAAISPTVPSRFVEDLYFDVDARSDVQRMMGMDLRITLADSDLRKVGRACDLAGVRVRYPFLDEKLFDFSSKVPPELLAKNGEIRYLYKKALSRILHRETITKPKHGFGLPTFEYINHDRALGDFFCDRLSALGRRPYFTKQAMEMLMGRVRSGEAQAHCGLAWDLSVLEIWLESRGL